MTVATTSEFEVIKRRRTYLSKRATTTVERMTPMITMIAKKMKRNLSPRIDLDDLIQDGIMGLVLALLRPQRPSLRRETPQLLAYITQVARGSMIDGMRESDAASRNERLQMRRVDSAIATLEHQLGRAPVSREIAEALGMSVDDYFDLRRRVDAYIPVSLDQLSNTFDEVDRHLIDRSVTGDPLRALELSQMRSALAGALGVLNKQERMVMSRYYQSEMLFREIGAMSGLSESKVCQIHGQAVAKLRAKLAANKVILNS